MCLQSIKLPTLTNGQNPCSGQFSWFHWTVTSCRLISQEGMWESQSKKAWTPNSFQPANRNVVSCGGPRKGISCHQCEMSGVQAVKMFSSVKDSRLSTFQHWRSSENLCFTQKRFLCEKLTHNHRNLQMSIVWKRKTHHLIVFKVGQCECHLTIQVVLYVLIQEIVGVHNKPTVDNRLLAVSNLLPF